MNEEIIRTQYKHLFDGDPLIVRSPGRINLIGEHTDYNEGFVLPAAIDKTVFVATGKRNDNHIHLYSHDFKESFTITVDSIRPVSAWPTYILGIVGQLRQQGFEVGGFNMVIGGDIPIGAGLSSSAAVECATVYALNLLFELEIDKIKMVHIAQKAEHEFAGVKCGIMDQFASMFGKRDNVMKLDCRSLDFEYFPLRMNNVKVVLLDTQVKHSLASSEYNVRRSQCEEGVAAIQAKYPSVNTLRDATLAMLQEVVPEGTMVYNRCKYVIEEKERLLKGCEDLQNNQLEAFGKKMFDTHEGLSTLYEVSCPELDYLVDAVKNNPAVLGARMMGGGFGGCTINLVQSENIDTLIKEVSAAYKRDLDKVLKAYIVEIEDGTSKILG